MSREIVRQWVEYHAPLSQALQQVGFGAEPVFSHAEQAWFRRQNDKILRWGLGAPVDDAAQALLAYFSGNPCSPNPIQAVTDFQNQYNATGPATPLVVDGKYGVNTQTAVQATLDAAGAGVAPSPCFDSSGNYVGPGSGGGAGGGSSSSTTTTTTSTTNTFFETYPYAKPILIGAAALATGYIGYKVLSKHKRSRAASHHRLAHHRHH